MATKTSQSTVSVSAETATVKPQAEAPVKIETSEDMRRRRAGIACFL